MMRLYVLQLGMRIGSACAFRWLSGSCNVMLVPQLLRVNNNSMIYSYILLLFVLPLREFWKIEHRPVSANMNLLADVYFISTIVDKLPTIFQEF